MDQRFAMHLWHSHVSRIAMQRAATAGPDAVLAQARNVGPCLDFTERRARVGRPGRDETCPVSTGGGTRRVQSVREGGRGGGGVTA